MCPRRADFCLLGVFNNLPNPHPKVNRQSRRWNTDMLGDENSPNGERKPRRGTQMADSAKQEQRRVMSERNRRRSGNAILEGAFTILPTFALIFAFVDFGLVLFRWTTLQN